MKATIWILSACIPGDVKPINPSAFGSESEAMAAFDTTMRQEWGTAAPEDEDGNPRVYPDGDPDEAQRIIVEWYGSTDDAADDKWGQYSLTTAEVDVPAPADSAVLAALKAVEWAGLTDREGGGMVAACPSCGAEASGHVHNDGCKLAAAIAANSTPAAPALGPVVIVMEGGLCDGVISRDERLIGQPYIVIDYDANGSSDSTFAVPQGNDTEQDACLGSGRIGRPVIDLAAVEDQFDFTTPESHTLTRPDHYESAARVAGWMKGGDGGGFIFHSTTWGGDWKSAASWSGTDNAPNGKHDSPTVYDTWKECCEGEDIDPTADYEAAAREAGWRPSSAKEVDCKLGSFQHNNGDQSDAPNWTALCRQQGIHAD